jgi:hypothetical protein
MKEALLFETKTVFVSYAAGDERFRNLLERHPLDTSSTYRYVHIPVKNPHERAWKEQVRMHIQEADGVIAIVTPATLSSSGEKWEIQCAREAGKKLIALWGYIDDRVPPPELEGCPIVEWAWPEIAGFIDAL